MTPNEALDELVKQAQELNMGYSNMYDMEDKEGLNLEPKKEITGYFIQYSGGTAIIQSDDHSICDGELYIIAYGKTISGFAKGEWKNYTYLPSEKIYRYYQERYFQPPITKPAKKWWQFWK